MKTNWQYIGREREYRFWKYSTGAKRLAWVFQVNESDNPPTNCGGYYAIDHVLRVKNCSADRLDKAPIKES